MYSHEIEKLRQKTDLYLHQFYGVLLECMDKAHEKHDQCHLSDIVGELKADLEQNSYYHDPA